MPRTGRRGRVVAASVLQVLESGELECNDAHDRRRNPPSKSPAGPYLRGFSWNATVTGALTHLSPTTPTPPPCGASASPAGACWSGSVRHPGTTCADSPIPSPAWTPHAGCLQNSSGLCKSSSSPGKSVKPHRRSAAVRGHGTRRIPARRPHPRTVQAGPRRQALRLPPPGTGTPAQANRRLAVDPSGTEGCRRGGPMRDARPDSPSRTARAPVQRPVQPCSPRPGPPVVSRE